MLMTLLDDMTSISYTISNEKGHKMFLQCAAITKIINMTVIMEPETNINQWFVTNYRSLIRITCAIVICYSDDHFKTRVIQVK